MNIVEILKNCPEGTKLYSPVFGEVTLVYARNSVIKCSAPDGCRLFYKDGTYSPKGECVLFPSKEQHDWNKFLIPFNNGDVIISTTLANPCCKHFNIAIFKEYTEDITSNNRLVTYCQVDGNGNFRPFSDKIDFRDWRLANEEEKETFFKKMKKEGYQWKNGELTKIVIPKFSVGDYITNDCMVLKITYIDDDHYYDAAQSARLEIKSSDMWRKITLFEPGDIITNGKHTVEIYNVGPRFYEGRDINNDTEWSILISHTEDWQIAKFNVNSLKPYDKVLVRFEDGAWYPSIVSYVSAGRVYLIDNESSLDYVIPFESNEHLIGKWDDPVPYYITWK